jgi:hypothetical protein
MLRGRIPIVVGSHQGGVLFSRRPFRDHRKLGENATEHLTQPIVPPTISHLEIDAAIGLNNWIPLS